MSIEHCSIPSWDSKLLLVFARSALYCRTLALAISYSLIIRSNVKVFCFKSFSILILASFCSAVIFVNPSTANSILVRFSSVLCNWSSLAINWLSRSAILFWCWDISSFCSLPCLTSSWRSFCAEFRAWIISWTSLSRRADNSSKAFWSNSNWDLRAEFWCSMSSTFLFKSEIWKSILSISSFFSFSFPSRIVTCSRYCSNWLPKILICSSLESISAFPSSSKELISFSFLERDWETSMIFFSLSSHILFKSREWSLSMFNSVSRLCIFSFISLMLASFFEGVSRFNDSNASSAYWERLGRPAFSSKISWECWLAKFSFWPASSFDFVPIDDSVVRNTLSSDSYSSMAL